MNTENQDTTSSLQHKLLGFAVALLLAVLTFFAVVKGSEIPLADLLSGLRTASPFFLICAFFSMLGFILFEGAALTVLVRGLGFRATAGQGVVYAAADIYFSAITPSASGGQPASAFFMIRNGIPATAIMAALLLNLIMYTLAVITVGIFALLLFPGIFLHFGLLGRICILIGILTLFGLTLLFLLLLRNQQLLKRLALGIAAFLDALHFRSAPKKIRHKLVHVLEEYDSCVTLVLGKRNMLLKVYLLNLLQRVSQLLVTVFTFLAIRGDASKLAKLFATQIYVVLGSNSMPLPGGIGVTDYLMLNGYMELMTREQAYRLELLSRGLSFYLCMFLSLLIVGVGYLFQKKNKWRKEEKNDWIL